MRRLLDRLSWGELGFKVKSGVDLRSGSSAQWCVVCGVWCVCIYFFSFSGVSLV
jgi:hypothetical protein